MAHSSIAVNNCTTKACSDGNKLRPQDQSAHDWYRFVLSFPPHLVRDYIASFAIGPGKLVLDPFCGTGTTLVECKKLGIASVGVEANPMAWFASRVKVDWNVEPDGLLNHAAEIAELTYEKLEREGFGDEDTLPLFRGSQAKNTKLVGLAPECMRLILKDSISPLPLHKTLVLLDTLGRSKDERYDSHERLALAKAVVSGVSNLHFGPEVGVGPPRTDAPVVAIWLKGVRAMADDLRQLRAKRDVKAIAHRADARRPSRILDANSVDAVITSPPYPNEKDYTRTTRLESVLLGFIRNKADLQSLKQGLIRSNTRCVYKADRDDMMVAQHAEIQEIAKRIEARRIELGKTSGFERLYARVTKLYFGGMAQHLSDLRVSLRPGALLAYVVGDQASYLRVMIRTGQILADIAKPLGYDVLGIDLFRTRLATATREQLREEVVLLRWPGAKPGRSLAV